jgi:hypothetical protein
MIWALDLDKPGKDTSVDSLIESGIRLDPKWGGSKRALLSARSATIRDNSYTLGLFWTACLPIATPSECPEGYHAIAFGHGKVFDADLSYLTGEGCHGKSNQRCVFWTAQSLMAGQAAGSTATSALYARLIMCKLVVSCGAHEVNLKPVTANALQAGSLYQRNRISLVRKVDARAGDTPLCTHRM